MTVNVVIQIGREIGRQIAGHAVEILERFKQRGRLYLDRLYADNRAGSPWNIAG